MSERPGPGARPRRTEVPSCLGYAQPGGVTKCDSSSRNRDTNERIVGDEGRAVEIGVVEQGCKMSRRRDPEARLDHAAAHNEKTVRARDRDHAKRLAQSSTFGQLDVDPVDGTNQPWNVHASDARFIGHNWERGALTHEAQAVDVMRGKWLLHELHVVPDENV